jgi:cytochrome c-type biogenesis protein
VFFVLGFCLFLAFIGALVLAASESLSSHALLITYVSVGLLVALGFYMLLSAAFPKLNYECHLSDRVGVRRGYLRSFTIGAIYSFLHLPCATPSLLAVTGLAVSSGSTFVGVSLLFFYFLGYGAPFLAVGLAFSALVPFFKKINEYRGVIYAMSGVLLMAAGLIILLGII